MALTKIQIISNSLTLLNKGPITSIADGGVFASSVENTFDYLLPSLLSKRNWRFATAIIPLSKTVNTPIVTEWQFIYQLPADYLSLYRLYPNTLEFQIYQNNLLYSNVDDLKIEYRFQPSITLLPPYFVEFFIWELASVSSLTGSASETLEAKLEKGSNKRRSEALAADSQSHPNQSIVDSPILSTRLGGEGQRRIGN